jgi:hypothetical protein
LRSYVDDDLFIEIFADISNLIRKSVRLIDKVEDDFVPEGEIMYIEELLGLSIVLLQTKILRVCKAAKASPLALSNARAVGGPYKGTGRSLAELIWALGNYYKHRNEWDRAVWKDKKAGETESSALRQSGNTRRIIEKVGIERFGNMRTAYDFFEIDWSSDCTPLAAKVQEWQIQFTNNVQLVPPPRVSTCF